MVSDYSIALQATSSDSQESDMWQKKAFWITVTFFSPHRVAIRDLLHSQSAVLSCWYKRAVPSLQKIKFCQDFYSN